MSESLTDFLLARIAEDEEAANAAHRESMRGHAGPGFVRSQVAWSAQAREVRGHELIERFTPARVLAECESKRKIVEDHKPIIVWPEGTGGAKFYTGQKWGCASCADGPTAEVPCRTLKFLALPYASHPSYREEWRP